MRRECVILTIAAALLIPAHLEAQRGRRGDDGRNRGREVETRRYDDDRRANVGHDTRRYERRFDVRDRRRWNGARWNRTHWGFSLHAPGRGFRSARVGQRALVAMLGPAAVSRIRRMARRSGFTGRITARWEVSRRYGRALKVQVGGRHFADIVDYNRDGYVDDVFYRRGRW